MKFLRSKHRNGIHIMLTINSSSSSDWSSVVVSDANNNQENVTHYCRLMSVEEFAPWCPTFTIHGSTLAVLCGFDQIDSVKEKK